MSEMIIPTAIEPNEKDQPLVTLDKYVPTLKTSESYRRLLRTLPVTVRQAKEILNKPLDKLTDDEIMDVQKQLKEPIETAKNIEKSVKALRSVFNHERDDMVDKINDDLEKAGYKDLKEAVTNATRLKSEVVNHRLEARWHQLEDHWNQLMEQVYVNTDPAKTMSLRLTELTFDRWRQSNVKLVSGAKTRKLHDSDFQLITDYLQGANNDFVAILNLKSSFEDELLRYYQSAPDLSQVLKYNDRLIAKQRAAVEAKKTAVQRQQASVNHVATPKVVPAKTAPKVTATPIVQPKPAPKKVQPPHLHQLALIWNILKRASVAHVDDDGAAEVLKEIRQIVNNV